MLTEHDLLIETLKFDPTKIYKSYDDFINTLPVMIDLEYFSVDNRYHGRHYFYFKLSECKPTHFRYMITNTAGAPSIENSVPIEFKHGVRTFSIPYDHIICQFMMN